MKRNTLLFLLFACFTQIFANNEIVVSPVTIPKGNMGMINIELNNDEVFTAFTFKLTLPEGLSYILDGSEDPKPTFNLGSRFTDHALSSSSNGQVATFGCLSISSAPISGSNGLLLSVYVTASDDLEVNEELTAILTEATFTTPLEVEYNLSDVNVNVTIGENRLVFDEAATTLPTYTAGEKSNVRMTRTIKANSWSTIVLPFTLAKTKAEAAFGNDVQLAEFSGFEVDYGDDDDNVVPFGITINFIPYTMSARKGMTGGKPFLIKTSQDITSFEADDVTLVGSVTDVNLTDEYETDGKFTGSFVKTKVPADGLFINGNKFWYSTGATNIKAFRGWFELGAVLDKETTDFEVKMYIIDDDDATRIDNVNANLNHNEAIFNLAGQRVGKNYKGVVIENGKKIIK